MLFQFKLATHFHCTREELLERMPASEWAYWVAKEEIDPLPDTWWQAALPAWILACVYSSNGAKPSIEDFIPRPKPRQSKSEIFARLKVIADVKNKAVRKPKGEA